MSVSVDSAKSAVGVECPNCHASVPAHLKWCPECKRTLPEELVASETSIVAGRSTARQLSLVGALGMLICFLLPWISVNCGAGVRSQPSGYDLARAEPLLWLVPLTALLVLTLFATRSVHLGRVSILSGATALAAMVIEAMRFFRPTNDPFGLQRAIAQSASAQVGGLLTLVFIAILIVSGVQVASRATGRGWAASKAANREEVSSTNSKTNLIFILLLGAGVVITWTIAQLLRPLL